MARLITILAAAYPRVTLSEATVELYSRMLADLDFANAQAAVVQHIATNPHFPSVAEIRRIAVERTCGLPTPLEAWMEVRVQMQAHGIYEAPTWSHPSVGRAVDAIGFRNLCMSENISVERAQFLRAYEAIRDQWILREQARPVEQLPRGSTMRVIAGSGDDIRAKAQ